MPAVVILQQILPKIANTFRENVSNRSEALVQPVGTLPCEEYLGFNCRSIETAFSSAGFISESWRWPNSEGQKLSDCGHLEPLLPDRAC